jgi:hypothetical protein
VHIGNDPRSIIPPRGYAGFGLFLVLRLESRDVGLDCRIVSLPFEKPADPLPGIAEQRPVDKIDRRGGALDVQQDGADLQLDLARSGM